jgi:diguanylate cyclase
VREIGALEKALRAFWLRLEFSGESQAELIRGLQRLLELMINNVGELVDDDAWVQGQVAELRNLVAAPLTARGLRDAERSLRGVIYKQALIKHSLDQTKSALKSMLTTFVERLAAIAAATGGYNERLGRYTRELESVRDVTALEGIVTAVVADARALQANIVRTRDELEEARIRVAEYESRIAGMRAELVALSAAVKEDVLTRALNRRGLEEAFAVEAARCDRSGAPLALALLDIDNFKALNDRLGHAVGDTALQHLADAVREALRPTDILARYGGEEFVVLLPGASLNEGREVMIRVQRALTRRYFMANNERVLVTFSAGVAVRRANESESVSIERADRALLRAKAEGKNRVATDADDGT